MPFDLCPVGSVLAVKTGISNRRDQFYIRPRESTTVLDVSDPGL
jgi:hypothetical protein